MTRAVESFVTGPPDPNRGWPQPAQIVCLGRGADRHPRPLSARPLRHKPLRLRYIRAVTLSTGSRGRADGRAMLDANRAGRLLVNLRLA